MIIVDSENPPPPKSVDQPTHVTHTPNPLVGPFHTKISSQLIAAADNLPTSLSEVKLSKSIVSITNNDLLVDEDINIFHDISTAEDTSSSSPSTTRNTLPSPSPNKIKDEVLLTPESTDAITDLISASPTATTAATTVTLSATTAELNPPATPETALKSSIATTKLPTTSIPVTTDTTFTDKLSEAPVKSRGVPMRSSNASKGVGSSQVAAKLGTTKIGTTQAGQKKADAKPTVDDTLSAHHHLLNVIASQIEALHTFKSNTELQFLNLSKHPFSIPSPVTTSATSSSDSRSVVDTRRISSEAKQPEPTRANFSLSTPPVGDVYGTGDTQQRRNISGSGASLGIQSVLQSGLSDDIILKIDSMERKLESIGLLLQRQQEALKLFATYTVDMNEWMMKVSSNIINAKDTKIMPETQLPRVPSAISNYREKKSGLPASPLKESPAVGGNKRQTISGSSPRRTQGSFTGLLRTESSKVQAKPQSTYRSTTSGILPPPPPPPPAKRVAVSTTRPSPPELSRTRVESVPFVQQRGGGAIRASNLNTTNSSLNTNNSSSSLPPHLLSDSRPRLTTQKQQSFGKPTAESPLSPSGFENKDHLDAVQWLLQLTNNVASSEPAVKADVIKNLLGIHSKPQSSPVQRAFSVTNKQTFSNSKRSPQQASTPSSSSTQRPSRVPTFEPRKVAQHLPGATLSTNATKGGQIKAPTSSSATTQFYGEDWKARCLAKAPRDLRSGQGLSKAIEVGGLDIMNNNTNMVSNASNRNQIQFVNENNLNSSNSPNINRLNNIESGILPKSNNYVNRTISLSSPSTNCNNLIFQPTSSRRLIQTNRTPPNAILSKDCFGNLGVNSYRQNDCSGDSYNYHPSYLPGNATEFSRHFSCRNGDYMGESHFYSNDVGKPNFCRH